MDSTSRTIIHFTKTIEALKGILKIGFKIKYCRERIMFGNTEKKLRVPVVSFCDIPICDAKENRSKYGNYALGLTEEWAMREGLTPVIYLQQHSHLAQSLLRALNAGVDSYTQPERELMGAVMESLKNEGKDAAHATLLAGLSTPPQSSEEDLLMDTLDILRYTKNYVGEL